MVSTNDVRPGMALDLDDGLFQILDYQHVKPGKGKAFVRMKLRRLDSGAVLDRTFRADEDVPLAYIERKDHQYLYHDDIGYHFMDLETFGQLTVTASDVGEAAHYLIEGTTVVLPLFEGRPIAVDVGTSVELRVTHAEPAVKGDRVSGATKPVGTETGLLVQVPLFVEEGDVIRVDPRTGQYQTRA